MRNGQAQFLKLVAIRIRELRGDESQESVCTRAGVSRRVLSDIERGARDFQISSLLRILRALDADLPGILGVANAEKLKHLQARRICAQVDELLSIGGTVEMMVTEAVAQWHRMLIGSRPPGHSKST